MATIRFDNIVLSELDELCFSPINKEEVTSSGHVMAQGLDAPVSNVMISNLVCKVLQR
jgi:hypothetical protein